ncbi:MAG TPA: sigma-70 family RNA polymerase sigma factor [Gemmatimonadales bacterium]|nr:sigma-70 family RNA polymerase sigma factor [Gemmatimonadales bacterium]
MNATVATQDDWAGHRAASLEALLMPLLDVAYGTALRLTRNPADAEDLVQESAFLATRGFGQFQEGTNFRAWFFRILTNCFYSKYRKRKREGTAVEIEDTPELFLYTQSAGAGIQTESEDPAGAFMDRLDTEAVASAIDALPEEYRVVATLYFMQDLQYQEIALMLGVPVGTVRSRLHRGRRLLQRALWSIAEEHGIISSLRREGAHDADC